MGDSGSEDITMSDNNSPDFEKDLISYALHPDRLFFIDNVEFWRDFHRENTGKYEEETPEHLCEYFIQRVLPQIKNHNLNEEGEYQLRLLALHPSYHRTEDGFVKMDTMERIELRHNCGNALPSSRQLDETSDDLAFVNNGNLNCQVVITPHDADSRNAGELSTETVVFLSAALSSDADLPLCNLRSTEDLKKGLQEAKALFERTGKELDNIKCSVEDLVEKTRTVCELKKTLSELFYKYF